MIKQSKKIYTRHKNKVNRLLSYIFISSLFILNYLVNNDFNFVIFSIINFN